MYKHNPWLSRKYFLREGDEVHKNNKQTNASGEMVKNGMFIEQVLVKVQDFAFHVVIQ